MKLYLVASILLAPLVFAAQPAPLAKVIYSDGFVRTESSYAVISYQRSRSFLGFNLFGNDWVGEYVEMVLSNENVRNLKDAQVSFVIEVVAGEPEVNYDPEFCKSNSSSYFRPLIEKCSGLVRLRKLRPEETSQMEEFKKEAEEAEKNVNVFYDSSKRSLVTKTFNLDTFLLHAVGESESMNIAAYREPYVSMNVMFEDHADKRFQVEAPASGNNCNSQPVDGLKVTFCAGSFQISELSDANSEVGNQSAETGPAGPSKASDISLGNLSEDELKKLLKIVLAKLRRK